uniref:Moricin-like peptide C5 n=1 Tax=Galleria mellonella TaxID=7137 RepID=A5JSV1_GALME|nr:moricin-like peptide C5 [Galleria mellonella]
MKLTGLFLMIMAVVALFISVGQADPKVPVGAIKKGGKAIKTGLGVVGAAGTAHEVYSHIRNRH